MSGDGKVVGRGDKDLRSIRLDDGFGQVEKTLLTVLGKYPEETNLSVDVVFHKQGVSPTFVINLADNVDHVKSQPSRDVDEALREVISRFVSIKELRDGSKTSS